MEEEDSFYFFNYSNNLNQILGVRLAPSVSLDSIYTSSSYMRSSDCPCPTEESVNKDEAPDDAPGHRVG